MNEHPGEVAESVQNFAGEAYMRKNHHGYAREALLPELPHHLLDSLVALRESPHRYLFTER